MKIVLTGGFLGSGKTTAIRQACSWLYGNGRLAAVVTNDQGIQLVDSKYIQAEKIPVCEVVNGCFCCNYPELDQHLDHLTQQYKPEIIFAESVGSCTDLIATVVNPLLQFKPETELVVSIFVDALVLLKLARNGKLEFDATVQYIYEKQLEEADLLVVSKADLISDRERKLLSHFLSVKYPSIKVLFHNSFDNYKIEEWVEELLKFKPSSKRRSLEIDYSIYGAGEAMLAWLDQDLVFESPNGNAAKQAIQLAENIYKKITATDLPIGHLKFLLETDNHSEKISFTQTIQSDIIRHPAAERNSNNASLLINARVQTHPDHLKQLMAELILEQLSKHPELKIRVKELSAFQPGFPKPTHRIAG